MFRRFLINSKKINCRRYGRHIKVYKFLPIANKNSTTNKESKLPPPTHIDEGTAELLERISLLGIGNKRCVQVLEEAIRFADQIISVDTTKVKPLLTVLEDESLYLREDEPKPDITKTDLLSHSTVLEENYFVTPPGNIQYLPEKKTYPLPALKEASKN